tara:strand:- start:2263 stop:2529 length:267 start_codon:yes stop_codon:yes gene_type:complete
MHSYYLHTENATQALDDIAKGLSNVRLSTDLHLSEQDFSLIDKELVLDEDNKLTVTELKKIIKRQGESISVVMAIWTLWKIVVLAITN